MEMSRAPVPARVRLILMRLVLMDLIVPNLLVIQKEQHDNKYSVYAWHNKCYNYSKKIPMNEVYMIICIDIVVLLH